MPRFPHTCTSPVPVPLLSRFPVLLPVSDPVSVLVPSSVTVPVLARVPDSVAVPELVPVPSVVSFPSLDPVTDVVPLVTDSPSLVPFPDCVLVPVVFSALVKYCSASKSVKSFCGVSLFIVLLVVEPFVESVVFPVVETVVETVVESVFLPVDETVVESVVEPLVSLERDVVSLKSFVRISVVVPLVVLSLLVVPEVVSWKMSLFSWCSK